MEGINHEAVGLAGHLKLGRLILMWDDNRITIDGPTDLSRNENMLERFDAGGWHTVECDGLDAEDVDRALTEAKADPRPSLVRCHTIIGYGAPDKQGTAAAHGSPLGAEEIAKARDVLDWHSPPFEIPDDVRQAWRRSASAARPARADWNLRLGASDKKEISLAGWRASPMKAGSGH